MTTIVFTSVPSELHGYFTKNKIYYVDKWASFRIAVITCDIDEDFHIDVENYVDCIYIDSIDDDFDGVAKGFSDMFY